MNKLLSFIGLLCITLVSFTACVNDATNAGQAVLDDDDAIIVLTDSFSIVSGIDSCKAIISQADSFLLGEIETDYGLLRASILTQLACPEGYSYPQGSVIDSICLFMYYSSWVGDSKSPIAISAYMMDKGTFAYAGFYPTDLNIADFCSRDKSILTDRSVIIASEKLDSIKNSNGSYVPMLRMRVNDDFESYFWAIQSFQDQDDFNDKFNGLLIETNFGSSTVLNISDIALGVYYSFHYEKAGKDTLVHDMKAFYANSEIRTVNHIYYQDKAEWIDQLKADSATHNYIIAPAGVYTRLTFPMQEMASTIYRELIIDSIEDGEGDYIYLSKRPYVNLAQVRVDVDNVFSGTSADKTRDDWLQPAANMLLIKEESMERFFSKKELPSDTCALLSTLQQGTDSLGDNTYYYSFDLSVFLTNQLRKVTSDTVLNMMLVPVTVSTSSSNVTTAVKQQQTVSATQIRSAQNGMSLQLIYSGF